MTRPDWLKTVVRTKFFADVPRLADLCETLAEGVKAVLACEVRHDSNGKSYLHVPASSIFDLGAQLRGLLNAYERGELEGEADA